MRRRSIGLGIVFGLLAMGGSTFVSTSVITAGASSAPAFPVVCKITATVMFTPTLTQAGTVSNDKASVTAMAVSAGKWSGCESPAVATAPSHGTPFDQTVDFPATKVGPRSYETGQCSLFTSPKALKALKGLAFNLAWTGGAGGTSMFTTTKVETTTNSDGELGLVFVGKEGTGAYAENSLNQIVEFFDLTTSSALQTNCAGAATVQSGTFDVANSVGII